MRCCVAIVALVACGKGPVATSSGSAAAPAPPRASGSAPPPGTASAPPPVADGADWTCDPLPFEGSTPLGEASGAALLDGKLVAVGDSGQHGAYAILDPESGKTLEVGNLPLGEPASASDDLEGLSAWHDTLVGISSAGWIRVWKRAGKGFTLVQGPYALGPVDLPVRALHHGIGDVPPASDGMVCPIEGTNCGRNYEGICLAPAVDRAAAGTCVGYALAKADGHLYCLTADPDGLRVHRDRAIEVGRPGTAADCAFADDGTLWVGHNVFAMNEVQRIDHAHALDPGHVRVVEIGGAGVGFSEAIAAKGDTIWRLSDSGGAPSLMAKFRCAPKPR